MLPILLFSFVLTIRFLLMKNRCLTEQVVLALVVNYMLYGRHSRCRKWRIRPAPEPVP